MIRITCLLIFAVIAACGMSGDLYLPDDPADAAAREAGALPLPEPDDNERKRIPTPPTPDQTQ